MIQLDEFSLIELDEEKEKNIMDYKFRLIFVFAVNLIYNIII